jgi:hypothetical protein
MWCYLKLFLIDCIRNVMLWFWDTDVISKFQVTNVPGCYLWDLPFFTWEYFCNILNQDQEQDMSCYRKVPLFLGVANKLHLWSLLFLNCLRLNWINSYLSKNDIDRNFRNYFLPCTLIVCRSMKSCIHSDMQVCIKFGISGSGSRHVLLQKSSTVSGCGKQTSSLKFIILKPSTDVHLPMATPSWPGRNICWQSTQFLGRYFCSSYDFIVCPQCSPQSLLASWQCDAILFECDIIWNCFL